MQTSERALELFSNSYSCAQAVLISFAQKVGIDEQTAFKIGAGLGGGVGKTQNICGAINAGAIILGLKFGNYHHDDLEAKNRLGELVGKYVADCKEELGYETCLELLKVDINNEQIKQFAKEMGLFDKVCNNAVVTAANVLESYLNRETI